MDSADSPPAIDKAITSMSGDFIVDLSIVTVVGAKKFALLLTTEVGVILVTIILSVFSLISTSVDCLISIIMKNHYTKLHTRYKLYMYVKVSMKKLKEKVCTGCL